VGASGNEDGDTLRLHVDSAGNIYFAGHTASQAIPWISSNAVQRTYGGGSQDMVFFVLSPDGTQILHATYLGGSGQDVCRSLGYRRN
jgi:hypothetical protein